MDRKPRKLSFEEAWDSATSFLVEDQIEKQIEQKIQRLDEKANHRISKGTSIKTSEVAEFLMEKEDNLGTILVRLGLPIERLLRIVTLLRRIGMVGGGFEREWDYKKIKKKIVEIKDSLSRLHIYWSMARPTPSCQHFCLSSTGTCLI